LVNGIFGWLLFALSLIGYIITIKRMNQKWAAWLVLAAGWALFSIAQTLLVTTDGITTAFIVSLWIGSYILVFTAVVLMFLKIVRLRQKAGT
jgi:hypothetical protein